MIHVQGEDGEAININALPNDNEQNASAFKMMLYQSFGSSAMSSTVVMTGSPLRLHHKELNGLVNVDPTAALEVDGDGEVADAASLPVTLTASRDSGSSAGTMFRFEEDGIVHRHDSISSLPRVTCVA